MEPNLAQVLFFQQIKALLPPNLSVVDEIANVLDISTDSAYRRIRGEKPISFDDLQKLSTQYQISVDQALNVKSNSFIFSGSLGFQPNDFCTRYLNNMLQQFEAMCSYELNHIYILSNDIAPFVYFQFPELSALTFFYYQKSILHFEAFKELKFSVNNLDPDLVKLGKKVQKLFNQIPSTEIWSYETINSILRHISFYSDTGVFNSKEDIACIFDKLDELVTHIEKQAELGLKFNYGELPSENAAPFMLYNNNLITGDNCVLAELGHKKLTYINHNLINFMYTRDEAFNQYTFQTFKNAISKSTQISLVSEKERAKFFAGIRKKIQAHKEMINHF